TNLKFTGLYLGGIIIAVFSICWWKKEAVKSILKKYAIIGLIAAVAFFIFGFNPYVTNVYNNGHVFFPLNTEKEYKVVLSNEPLMLNGKSKITKLFISTFAAPANDMQQKEIRWKSPVTVSKEDLR